MKERKQQKSRFGIDGIQCGVPTELEEIFCYFFVDLVLSDIVEMFCTLKMVPLGQTVFNH